MSIQIKMDKHAKDLFIILLGSITTLFTTIVLVTVQGYFGFAFYSFMLWFVIPGGSLLSGFAAGSGFYLGARILNHKPGKMVFLSVAVTSLSIYFIINFLLYLGISFHGVPIKEHVSFAEFLTEAIQSSHHRLFVRGAALSDTWPIGKFGYLEALLQVLGFALGSYTITEMATKHIK